MWYLRKFCRTVVHSFTEKTKGTFPQNPRGRNAEMRSEVCILMHTCSRRAWIFTQSGFSWSPSILISGSDFHSASNQFLHGAIEINSNLVSLFVDKSWPNFSSVILVLCIIGEKVSTGGRKNWSNYVHYCISNFSPLCNCSLLKMDLHLFAQDQLIFMARGQVFSG